MMFQKDVCWSCRRVKAGIYCQNLQYLAQDLDTQDKPGLDQVAPFHKMEVNCGYQMSLDKLSTVSENFGSFEVSVHDLEWSPVAVDFRSPAKRPDSSQEHSPKKKREKLLRVSSEVGQNFRGQRVELTKSMVDGGGRRSRKAFRWKAVLCEIGTNRRPGHVTIFRHPLPEPFASQPALLLDVAAAGTSPGFCWRRMLLFGPLTSPHPANPLLSGFIFIFVWKRVAPVLRFRALPRALEKILARASWRRLRSDFSLQGHPSHVRSGFVLFPGLNCKACPRDSQSSQSDRSMRSIVSEDRPYVCTGGRAGFLPNDVFPLLTGFEQIRKRNRPPSFPWRNFNAQYRTSQFAPVISEPIFGGSRAANLPDRRRSSKTVFVAWGLDRLLFWHSRATCASQSARAVSLHPSPLPPSGYTVVLCGPRPALRVWGEVVVLGAVCRCLAVLLLVSLHSENSSAFVITIWVLSVIVRYQTRFNRIIIPSEDSHAICSARTPHELVHYLGGRRLALVPPSPYVTSLSDSWPTEASSNPRRDAPIHKDYVVHPQLGVVPAHRGTYSNLSSRLSRPTGSKAPTTTARRIPVHFQGADGGSPATRTVRRALPPPRGAAASALDDQGPAKARQRCAGSTASSSTARAAAVRAPISNHQLNERATKHHTEAKRVRHARRGRRRQTEAMKEERLAREQCRDAGSRVPLKGF
ncbi:hypothetical protein FB451DRAFT_1506411 [Mycena latifolia]|nr:hypothetical protein FB451DRAFT_1506411 [Mycena latifolia]